MTNTYPIHKKIGTPRIIKIKCRQTNPTVTAKGIMIEKLNYAQVIPSSFCYVLVEQLLFWLFKTPIPVFVDIYDLHVDHHQHLLSLQVITNINTSASYNVELIQNYILITAYQEFHCQT